MAGSSPPPRIPDSRIKRRLSSGTARKNADELQADLITEELKHLRRVAGGEDMPNNMEAAAEAVRSILPSPFQLSEGVAHRGTSAPARFAVLDGLDRKVCELVISHEAAAASVVTYAWLRRADLPGKLREAIAAGRNVYITSDGVSVRR